jgi:hypothetical protein
VTLTFAALGGGCWSLIGADYRRQVKERAGAVTLPDPLVHQQLSESGTRIAELETRFGEFERDAKERQGQAIAESTRRKSERRQIAGYLEAGNQIKMQVDTLDERTEMEKTALEWNETTYRGLEAMDPSYAARFKSVSGASYSRSREGKALPMINQNIWNFVNVRTETLNRILETMPQ